MTISEKLQALRQQMARENIQTYIVTKFDPHQGEYMPDYWNGVQFISGFTGSQATVVVTKTEAGLWTDGRYYVQAEKELAGSGIKVHRAAEPQTKSFIDYAKDETPSGGAIGFDGRTMSMEQAKTLLSAAEYRNITLKTDKDLLNEIWADRPALPTCKVFEHALEFCGVSRIEKIKTVREKMNKEGGGVYIISSLDDIAWLFNLRGDEIRHCMLFSSYAIVSADEAVLFIAPEKVDIVKAQLESDSVTVRGYDEVFEFLNKYADKTLALLNPAKTSYSMFNACGRFKIRERKPDITSELKAVKNDVEIKNIKAVNIRDGATMVRFEKWLKETVSKQTLTEYEVMQKINELRSENENFIKTSFNTICAYMANGAMMHYRTSSENSDTVRNEGMLLLDSGGNYYDGTTDITRTYILGSATAQMKRDFTLVLKSHIALARAIFLYGATGANLDTLARMPMWTNCMNYKSGTGHGIGFCLNVHEGPHSISQLNNPVKLEPGMIVTNEPGVYRSDEYGIRTENTILVKDFKENEFGRFMCFETVSLCPIDLDGLDMSIMTPEEIEWLNDYHKEVFEKLSPLMKDEDEREYLRRVTRAV